MNVWKKMTISNDEYEEYLLKAYNMLDEDDNVSNSNKKEFERLMCLIDEYEWNLFPLEPKVRAAL
jgi:hypothetical protein